MKFQACNWIIFETKKEREIHKEINQKGHIDWQKKKEMKWENKNKYILGTSVEREKQITQNIHIKQHSQYEKKNKKTNVRKK